KIDSGYDFSMNQQQQAVSGKKVREDRTAVLPGHDLVHGVLNRLETLKILDSIDDRRLAYIELNASAAEDRPKAREQGGLGVPPREGKEKDCQQGTREESNQDLAKRTGGHRSV